MWEYEELRVRVRPVGDGRHLVAASGPATAAEVREIPADRAGALGARWARLIASELGTGFAEGGPSPVTGRELGREVYGLLFGEALGACLREAVDRAQRARPERRLRIRFDLPPELRDLPVEALCAPADEPLQNLALDRRISLARTLPGRPLGNRLPAPDDLPSRIRLVVAVASPPGLPELDGAAEIAALHRELPDVLVQTVELRNAGRRALEAQFAACGDEPTALLLIAHGTYDHEQGAGQVCLETASGAQDWVPAGQLAGLLLKAPQLRLAALNICSGADSSRVEPFSGVAQALVAGGLPAAVAMRGPVTDVCAGKFSPVLLAHLAANATLDEAVAAARAEIGHVPEHTDVEWATPALFLHEECRHGWLFKARVIRDARGDYADPVREGERALLAVESLTGNIDASDVIAAARHLRTRGAWDQVLRKLQMETEQYEAEQRWLREEAQLELAWPATRDLCALLAAGADADAAGQHLTALRGQVPHGHLGCLDAEVRALRLAELTRTAERARDEGAWEAAAAAYGELLADRPDDEELRARAHDVAGRLAEAAGDWERAAAEYADCADRAGLDGAAARAAYARGRVAAAAGSWRRAREEFTAAAKDGDGGGDGWLGYATGRAAAAAGDWTAAAEALAADPEFEDAADLLPWVRGRQAAERGDWDGALEHLTEAATRGHACEPWLSEAMDQVHASAAEAEESGDWPLAATRFAAVSAVGPAGHPRRPDAVPPDAVHPDAGLPDTGHPKTGRPDAAHPDARPPDTGHPNAGHPDAGHPETRHPDAGPRRRYAEARVAEARAGWAEAARAYAASGHADARALHTYALGRALEEREDWEGAGEQFAGLPSHLRDVAERTLYVRGRAADRHADWPGVIEGFGRLPDSYADGDVGTRRRHARARTAESVHDWDSVLGLLTDLPGTERDGAVGLLRAKATGKLAEQTGDWRHAHEVYAAGGPGDGELVLLCRYARGRALELEEAWDGALEAYLGLPDGWGDAGIRGAYAGARLVEAGAEDTAGWRRAGEEYGALPREFEDVAARAGYVRAREAEAAGDWEGAARQAEALGEVRDAPGIAAYARARTAEARQEWRRAVEHYRACGERRDAGERLAYAEGRVLEADGRWSAAVAAYRRACGSHDRADVRRRRLQQLLGLLPWADGLPCAPLVCDPFALRDATYPYLALREAGVDPGAPWSAVRDATYTLMERRTAMTWQERMAWKQLQLPAQRLLLDAMLYRLHDPDTLRERLAELSPEDADGGAGFAEALCRELPRDAPLLLLLARGREAAIEEWETRLREAPGDMAVLHGLAVARLWQAKELEESGAWEHAVVAWGYAVAYWATLLADDGHWERWRQERAACYGRGAGPEDVARLRWKLGQYLSDQFSAYGQRHADADRPGQARAYWELGDALEAELGGARQLGELGGLPLGAGAAGTAGGRLACGPAYLRLLGLGPRLGELAARLDETVRRGEGPAESAVRELRVAFSELSTAFALFGMHKFDEALRALPPLREMRELPEDCEGPLPGLDQDAHLEGCAHCADYLGRNPAYLRLPGRGARLLQDTVDLAAQMRLALARTALASGGSERALEEWRAAVRTSRLAGMQTRTKASVVRTALGRAKALAEAEGAQRGACLDEAVELMENTLTLGPFDRESLFQLRTRLSKLLSARGVWRGSTCEHFGLVADFEAAEADLRRALEHYPDSLYARDNLARALVFTLGERQSEISGKLPVLLEALGILDSGLRDAPVNSDFLSTLREALEALEALLVAEFAPGDFTRMMRDINEEPVPEEGAEIRMTDWARELAAKAEDRVRAGELLRGLHYLIRATRADAANPGIRRALLDGVRSWLDEEGNGRAGVRK
ncbi:CHAT domain-containing protein [Streptomyces sp. NPDC048172]|uniref:CHAT domain-containing protein n=1 Tax=Streptomyces sp. NPDC048172 TaxID=3365505 RepID=UPI00371AC24C